MKRLTRRRSAAAVLALVVALCVLLLSTSNAARLDLTADGSIAFAQGAKRCTDGPLTVSPSGTPVAGRYTEVTVSGITGDCAGGNVSVYQQASPHAVLFSGSGTVSGSTMKVTAAAFTPAASGLGVVVGLDGWAVPATWHFTPPMLHSAVSCSIPGAPGVQCTATIGSGTAWPGSSPTHFNRFITVTTTSPTPVEWEVTFNFSSPDWPIANINRVQDVQAGLVRRSFNGCSTQPRLVIVRGTTAWGDYHRVSAATPRTMQIEGSNTGGSGNLLTCS